MYVFLKTCFQRVAHVENSVSMQQHFEQFVGKQRRLEGKYLGISEAEPQRYDCVNQFSHKGTAVYDLWLLDSSNSVSSGDTLTLWCTRVVGDVLYEVYDSSPKIARKSSYIVAEHLLTCKNIM